MWQHSNVELLDYLFDIGPWAVFHPLTFVPPKKLVDDWRGVETAYENTTLFSYKFGHLLVFIQHISFGSFSVEGRANSCDLI